MKILIIEDDFTNRLLLKEILKKFGEAEIAVNGKEALLAVSMALKNNEPYDLICLDIMMPEMDGQQALKEIRALEKSQCDVSFEGSKIIMTTALRDIKNVMDAYGSLCDAYLTKPIAKANLLREMKKLNLI